MNKKHFFTSLAVSIAVLQLTSGGTVTLTPTQASTCTGAMVTFTCQVMADNLNSLFWVVTTQNDGSESTTFHVVSNIAILAEGQPTNFSTSTAVFVVVLVSSSAVSFVTTLTTGASPAVDDATFRCESDDDFAEASLALSADTVPAAPQSLNAGIALYHTAAFTATVQWSASPRANSYSATIESDTSLIENITTTNTSFQYTFDYNVEYNISVKAVNCGGESSVVSAPVLEVGCDPPIPPSNGQITEHVSSQVGAEVAFQCQPGLQPAGAMAATCTTQRTWSPDPADTLCSDPQGLSRQAETGIAVGVIIGALLAGGLTAFLIGYCIYTKTCRKRHSKRVQERDRQYDTMQQNEAYEAANTREYETLSHTNTPSNQDTDSANYYLVGQPQVELNQPSKSEAAPRADDGGEHLTVRPGNRLGLAKPAEEYELADNAAYAASTQRPLLHTARQYEHAV